MRSRGRVLQGLSESTNRAGRRIAPEEMLELLLAGKRKGWGHRCFLCDPFRSESICVTRDLMTRLPDAGLVKAPCLFSEQETTACESTGMPLLWAQTYQSGMNMFPGEGHVMMTDPDGRQPPRESSAGSQREGRESDCDNGCTCPWMNRPESGARSRLALVRYRG